MKLSYIAFTAKEQAELVTKERDIALGSRQVLIRTQYSAVSAGTELANYHALPNTGTTGYIGMEGGAKLIFPFQPGYSCSGYVEAVGKDVTTVKVGDNVTAKWCGHQSWHIVEEDQVIQLPKGVELIDAAFTHISSFPMLGVRKLRLELGESAMIAGLGILGMFALQFARLSGAYPVIVSDLSEERRNLALQLGADLALDPRDPDFLQKVKDATEGRGPNGVVEVTGSIAALKQALEYIAWEGRITLLGCTRVSNDTIDFYKYVHKRGISLIGCHTATRPSVDSQPGKWTEIDDYHTYFRLLAAKRVQVRPCISRLAKPEDAGAVYHELGFSKNPPLGMVFDWRNI